MTVHSVGICSLAINFPSLIRTNGYWDEKFPDLANPSKAGRLRLPRVPGFASSENGDGMNLWSQAVSPYLSDPFRGSVERRVLAQGESSLMLECCAAQDALEAANLCPENIDLAIATSIFSEQTGFGHAAPLARELGLRCPAWNLESTCSSALVALQTARALVQAGEHRRVLVVVSHMGSRAVDEADTLSWSMGDGAGAFIVSALKPEQGVLSTKVVSTTATWGAYCHEWGVDDQGVPWQRLRTGENASAIAETAGDFVRDCCTGAAAKADISLNRVDFFVFNTPTAWYANVCTQALGIDPERTLNLYPRYANIGPVFPIANLYHAVQSGKLRENDLVLVYTNGADATAAATVMRWGDVSLGTAPAPPLNDLSSLEAVQFATSGSYLSETSSATQASPLSRAMLLATLPSQQQQLLESYLQAWLASALQVPRNQISTQQPFATLLDSLMALMFRSHIETDLQVKVSMEQFFGSNTLTQLAETILNRIVLEQLVLKQLLRSEQDADTTSPNAEEKREQLTL